MPIVTSDLKLYRAETVSDGATNGGRMSANEIASGALKNVFPSVGDTERAAGSTKLRKVFVKVANDDDLTFQNPAFYLDRFTAGDDRVTFFLGTPFDTENDIDTGARKFGCGSLDQSVSPGATEIDVLVEDGPSQPFQDGDRIRITDLTDIDDLTGNEEYVLIDGAPSVAGDVITLTLASALQNGYSSADTRVMNAPETPDVAALIDYVSVISTGGTFDPVNLLPDAIGGIDQHFTLTFTSATVFNIVGDTLGSVGSGNIGSGASPVNADFTKPYFVMESAGFGGTFQAGDMIEFDTISASQGIWFERIVPVAASALTLNEAVFVADGETENA
jgi:hypothetical protein